jgi:type IV secretory pathway VirB4 component
MSGIEQLKRRMEALAPVPKQDQPSIWDRKTPDEKRAECRHLIEVWLRHTGETITPEEMEAAITRIITDAESKENRTIDSRTAVQQMSDAEIESRAREIITGRERTGAIKQHGR